MNSTVAFNTEAEIEQIFASENSVLDASYATAPMLAVLPAYQLPSEEELHSSFEEAISGRLLAVHSRFSRLSSTSRPAIAYTDTGSLPHSIVHPAFHSPYQQPEQTSDQQSSWKKIASHATFAFLCLLTGFDLMGLLVLHMR